MMIPSSTIDAMVQEQADRLDGAKRDADARVATIVARLEATNALLQRINYMSASDFVDAKSLIAANAEAIKQAKGEA